jgi:hypothetical protein
MYPAKATYRAGSLSYCGIEFKRRVNQWPVDHELDVRAKVYENGRVAADPETFGLLKRNARYFPTRFERSATNRVAGCESTPVGTLLADWGGCCGCCGMPSSTRLEAEFYFLIPLLSVAMVAGTGIGTAGAGCGGAE